MNQYLYRIKPARMEMLTEGATPEEQATINEHFSYLETLTNASIVILAGRTLVSDLSTFGIVIFLAEQEESAINLMNDDPAVKGRVMVAELFPFRVSLMAGRVSI